VQRVDGPGPPTRGSLPCHGREAYDWENLYPGPRRDVTGYVPFSTSTSPGWAPYAPVFGSRELSASPPLSMHEVVSLTTELLPARVAAAGVRAQFRPEASRVGSFSLISLVTVGAWRRVTVA
jgi:hypothetical protein